MASVVSTRAGDRDGDQGEDERLGTTGRRNETRAERVDRELIELLNELRVALPGVQFLFAFLLIVPFQQTIGRATDFQKDVYLIALVTAATATGLLIAPAAWHRILFRQHDKEKLLKRSSRSALAGLVVLAVSITTAILLVVDVLLGRTQAWVTSAGVGLFLAVWWLALPFWQRAHNEQDSLDDMAEA